MRVKAADQNYVHRGQNLVERRLKTNYFKTARLMKCSGLIAVNICVKWINDGDTIALNVSAL